MGGLVAMLRAMARDDERDPIARKAMPHPELRGIMRRLRWIAGFPVYDWDRERWVTRG